MAAKQADTRGVERAAGALSGSPPSNGPAPPPPQSPATATSASSSTTSPRGGSSASSCARSTFTEADEAKDGQGGARHAPQRTLRLRRRGCRLATQRVRPRRGDATATALQTIPTAWSREPSRTRWCAPRRSRPTAMLEHPLTAVWRIASDPSSACLHGPRSAAPASPRLPRARGGDPAHTALTNTLRRSINVDAQDARSRYPLRIANVAGENHVTYLGGRRAALSATRRQPAVLESCCGSSRQLVLLAIRGRRPRSRRHRRPSRRWRPGWRGHGLAGARCRPAPWHARYWNDGARRARTGPACSCSPARSSAPSCRAWQGAATRPGRSSAGRMSPTTRGCCWSSLAAAASSPPSAPSIAKGCTSGQALTGGSMLNVGSLVFMLAVFASAYALAYFVRKEWL
ncbi:MAG: hypothetical protein MZV64_48520 [Ignavibacteriales bacterium]|nr:hypothetical protein [Ignavibacteriales bacterium]